MMPTSTLRTPPRGPFSYTGLAPGGLGTDQVTRCLCDGDCELQTQGRKTEFVLALKASHPKSLMIFACDRRAQLIAILLVMFRRKTLPNADPEVLQSRFGVEFFCLGLADFRRIACKFLSEFFGKFFCNFFDLVSPGVPPPNSRTILSAFLSNFRFLNPKCFTPIFCLRGRSTDVGNSFFHHCWC